MRRDAMLIAMITLMGAAAGAAAQPCDSAAVYSAMNAEGTTTRGVSAAGGALIGDDLHLTMGGVLESAVFSIYNDADSSTTLESADVELVFFDLTTGAEVGAIELLGLGLGLSPGQHSLIQTGDVSALGIVLPQDVLAGVVITNHVGGERVGQACVSTVDIGATGAEFYLSDGVREGFFTPADPDDPNTADPNAHLIFEIVLDDGVVDCNMNGVADAEDLAAGTSADCDGDGVPDECQFPQDLVARVSETYSHIKTIIFGRVGAGQVLRLQTPRVYPIDDWAHHYLFETTNAGAVTLTFATGEDYEGEISVEVATWGNGFGPALASEEFDLDREDEVTLPFFAEAGRPYLIRVLDDRDRSPDEFTFRLDGPYPDLPGDCTVNGIYDACEPDCDGDGTADVCEIASGTQLDCDLNGVPDDCEIASGARGDCDGDGVLDDCEADCNENGEADICEVLAGAAPDCNGNGVPDICDISPPAEFTTSLGAAPDLRYNDQAPILEFDANGLARIPVPFHATYLHTDELTIARNGVVAFGALGGLPAENMPIPNAAVDAGAPLAFVHWDEYLPTGGWVRWQVVGVAPDRTLEVEWREVPWDFGDGEVRGDHTFYLLVHETPIEGAVLQFHYAHVSGAAVSGEYVHHRGSSATVGMQWNGVKGVEYSFNSEVIRYPVRTLSLLAGPPTSFDVDVDRVPDECQRGDLNCDGVTDMYDIDAFVLALSGEAVYGAAYPDCPRSRADCDGDGRVDTYDIDAFVTLLVGE